MQIRTYIIAILLFAFLIICSLPVICDEAASAPASAAVEAKEPAKAPEEAKPAPAAEVAPAKPSALSVPDTATVTNTSEQQPRIAAISDITPDTNIFRRTPKIDGVVDDGEWDVYYSHSADGIEITTYANWDTDNLYFAAKSDKPVDFLALLDANCDGWYNGEDNYEFRVVRASEGPSKMIVNRYDSRNARTPTASAVTAEEASLVEMKSSTKDGIMSIEMRIPANLVRNFKLRDGRRLAVLLTARTGADEAAWIASGSPGDTKELTLVGKKFASLQPLELGFDLRDSRIARGDELVAKFHLTNTGAEALDVRSYVIAGEGKAGGYLSSQKVRMEGLPSRKHLSKEIRSVIPQDMPLGSWALGAEVNTADSKLGGALVSFEVVEPFELSLRVPTDVVKSTVKDVTVGVVITNNTRGRVRGEATVTMPEGWEIWKDEPKRGFSAPSKGFTSVLFKVKPPLGASGRIPVKMGVALGGKTLEISGDFVMANQ